MIHRSQRRAGGEWFADGHNRRVGTPDREGIASLLFSVLRLMLLERLAGGRQIGKRHEKRFGAGIECLLRRFIGMGILLEG